MPFALVAGIALAVQAAAYGATPEAAATGVARTGVTSAVRVNVVGRFAVVLVRGGTVEGERFRGAVLVERFSFGWQPLEILNFRCRLDAHDLPRGAGPRLMAGMPIPDPPNNCGTGLASDAGPTAQVAAVRRLMQGPLVPAVAVSDRYALGQWYGAGGGQTLFRFSHGAWRRIAGGGGPLSVREMRQYNVPQSPWCGLHVFDAPCRV